MPTFPYTLRHMCRNTIIVEPPLNAETTSSSVSAYGVAYFGTATTYTCRIVSTPKVVTNGQGQQVTSAAHAVIAYDVKVDPRSRITLSSKPNGCSSQPDILSVAYYPAETSDGMSHSTVYF